MTHFYEASNTSARRTCGDEIRRLRLHRDPTKERKNERTNERKNRCVVGGRGRERVREASGRRARARRGRLSHDRARCNARAAMHKQRRASRSAPAKVTRVMSRCPLCRTNSATRPKALSSPFRRVGGTRDERAEVDEEKEEEEEVETACPSRSSLPLAPSSPSRWNPLSRGEREPCG